MTELDYYSTSTAADRGEYILATSGATSTPGRNFVTGTEQRDVSPMLDLLALAETPFINKIGWGSESGGIKIEWVTENLGPGYIITTVGAASGACTSIVCGSVEGMTTAEAVKQVMTGTVLYHYSSTDAADCMFVAVSVNPSGAGDGSVTCSSIISIYADESSTAIGDKIYVIGAFANEGSKPRTPNPRNRVVCSNEFTILRQDVAITGSMQKTDMYAIGSEEKHQILMRLKEMQRERERAALYSHKVAKTSVTAGMMHGVYGFLFEGAAGDASDHTTRNLTETAVNTVVNKLWENGGRNLSFWGHISQCALFTRWDKNRIRMRVEDGKGGGHINSYLTEAGITLDIHPMAHVPPNLAFVLDTSKIRLRAKRGRKAIMEKLGKMGDFTDWQIISEFSMEMKGYNLNQHGMFTALA
jgi:hypothetical protein